MARRPSGNYVRIRGTIFPVTGRIQRRTVKIIMNRHKLESVPITHWDGEEWTDTGFVFEPFITKEDAPR